MEWKHYKTLTDIKESYQGMQVSELAPSDVTFLEAQGLVEINPIEKTANITVRGIKELGRFKEA